MYSNRDCYVCLQMLMSARLVQEHAIPMLIVPTLVEAMNVTALLGSLGME